MGKKLSFLLIAYLFILVSLLGTMGCGGDGRSESEGLTSVELLGKRLFFDINLSEPRGQACAACHAPEVGFTGPENMINSAGAVYEGAVLGRFGNRKPPSAAYGGDSPVLYYDVNEEVWVGGMFWDGRATGWTLSDPLAEQAQGPFLNPLEQNLPNAAEVIRRVCFESSYTYLFKAVCGYDACLDINVNGAYDCIGRSIAAYERSKEVQPFTSKYDYYLSGQATLTEQEMWGLELFEGKAMCSACHVSQMGSNGEHPLFTDFTYDNLGVPKNLMNPFYSEPDWNPDGASWIDYGLGGFLKSIEYDSEVYEAELGKHKVPTLRNVDKRPYPEFVKAYAHNGSFKSLEEIVHFYNTRDVEIWPSPEVPINVNTDELGDLGLTSEEEAAIVAFLKTLSDGYAPSP
jgi:cytochrome c peroxidase